MHDYTIDKIINNMITTMTAAFIILCSNTVSADRSSVYESLSPEEKAQVDAFMASNMKPDDYEAKIKKNFLFSKVIYLLLSYKISEIRLAMCHIATGGIALPICR